MTAPLPVGGALDAERAFDAYRIAQTKIIGMPGLMAAPCFAAGYQAGFARAQQSGAGQAEALPVAYRWKLTPSSDWEYNEWASHYSERSGATRESLFNKPQPAPASVADKVDAVLKQSPAFEHGRVRKEVFLRFYETAHAVAVHKAITACIDAAIVAAKAEP